MLSSLIYVALGGAIGASLRFLTGVGLFRAFGPQEFPVAILTVNVIGSFAMGFFVVTAAHRGLAHLNPFILTGIMGGFTTFSAFSLEAFTLYERGAIGQAALYVALSVGLSIGALMLGIYLARGLWT